MINLIILFFACVVIFLATSVLAHMNKREDGEVKGAYVLMWMVTNALSMMVASVYVYENYLREFIL